VGRVKTIEFELERTVQAPIDQVYARLVDIDGHNAWVDKKRSMLKQTRQTSPGEPGVGTTYVDDTKQGELPGEIVELEAPHTVVFHWWDKTKAGKVRFEGWPSYSLQSTADGGTLVRHRAKLDVHGAYQWGAPIFRRLAMRERTATIDALKASFSGPAGPR
jgi:uncharacterized protein YndB with AHSA1/START domain